MIAWVFPGQGSQKVGMSRGLDAAPARQTFAEASEILRWDVQAVCDDGPAERLNSTEVAQVAIFTTSIAAANTLEAFGLLPDLVAGHSVGEFAALVVARAMSFDDGLRAVAARGEAMANAGRGRPGAMAAVLGAPLEVVRDSCERVPGIVAVANVNSSEQIVISGERAAVDSASELARSAGARRIIPLAVSVAAHSPLMTDAQQALRAALDQTTLLEPVVPFASCISGLFHRDPDEIRDLLVAALVRPVVWTACVDSLLAAGTGSFVEVGPGQVLAGLSRRNAPGVPVTSVGDSVSAAAFTNSLLSEVRA